MAPFNRNAAVRHPRFGPGQVTVDQGDSVVVRFEHGIEECLAVDLEFVEGLAERMAAGRLDPALHVVTRILGECIRSVNDAWGVFSRSRIALLPHQLWVCKRVLESWPTRWLVADDVGLGKTIEAGLILTPLLSSGRVRRLLVLAPASLVEQWQVRLREMFDIRISIYVPAADTETSDFWNTQDRVIASAHTLRLDKGNRWERLCDAKSWDLVLIDEAHHLNVDEQGHRTLSYQLVERLQERGKGAVPGAVHRYTASGQGHGIPVAAEASSTRRLQSRTASRRAGREAPHRHDSQQQAVRHGHVGRAAVHSQCDQDGKPTPTRRKRRDSTSSSRSSS